MFCMLHPNSKSANILKVLLQRRHILKALQLFKGSSLMHSSGECATSNWKC